MRSRRVRKCLDGRWFFDGAGIGFWATMWVGEYKAVGGIFLVDKIRVADKAGIFVFV